MNSQQISNEYQLLQAAKYAKYCLMEAKRVLELSQDLFTYIETFRSRTFYDNLNRIEEIEQTVEEILEKLKTIKMACQNSVALQNQTYFINGKTIEQHIKIAADKIQTLVYHLSELSRDSEKNIIAPAADAIWNIKSTCEIVVAKLEERYPQVFETKKITPVFQLTSNLVFFNEAQNEIVDENFEDDHINEATHLLSSTRNEITIDIPDDANHQCFGDDLYTGLNRNVIAYMTMFLTAKDLVALALTNKTGLEYIRNHPLLEEITKINNELKALPALNTASTKMINGYLKCMPFVKYIMPIPLLCELVASGYGFYIYSLDKPQKEFFEHLVYQDQLAMQAASCVLPSDCRSALADTPLANTYCPELAGTYCDDLALFKYYENIVHSDLSFATSFVYAATATTAFMGLTFFARSKAGKYIAKIVDTQETRNELEKTRDDLIENYNKKRCIG